MRAFFWSIVAAALAGATPAPASAGLINWSYANTAGRDDIGLGYWFNPGGNALATPAGRTESISLVSAYGTPWFDYPLLPQGPVLPTGVTITDAESGLSRTFGVLVEFYDALPVEAQAPRLVPFDPFAVDLGRHRYTVANGPYRGALSVRVDDTAGACATPEPAALGLATMGLVGAGLARVRRRWCSVPAALDRVQR